MRDYYAVLGVEAGATAIQIRRAFEGRARRYSPDVNFWDHGGRAVFVEILHAFRILSDPTARTVYDRQGAPVVRDRATSPGATRGGRRGDALHVSVEVWV